MPKNGDKPHIVHILGTMGSGGAQRLVLDLALSPALQCYRHSIICVLGKTGELLETAVRNKIPVYSCPTWWPQSTIIPSYRINRRLRQLLIFTFPWRLAALLGNINADLVNTHVTTSNLYAQGKAVIHYGKLPWVWTVHGLYRSRGDDVSQWKKTIGLVNRSSSAAITGVSQAGIDEVKAEGDVIEGKCHVIYNGVVRETFNPMIEHDDPEWRDKMTIPKDAVVFGSAGRLIDLKRQDIFIEAAATLIKNGSTAHFVLAGDGPLRSQLAELISKLEIGTQFHLIGYQTDMQRFLREIDIFVLTSDSESFSKALIEACAMNLPCISTSVGGAVDVLGNEAGILVSPGSVEEVAQAMLQMLSETKREAYASKAQAVIERFSMENCSLQYRALYENLLSKK